MPRPPLTTVALGLRRVLSRVARDAVRGRRWAEKTGIELPYTIGHENAGWVHEVGSAVSNVEVGDAVILHPLITCGLCRS